MVGRDLGHSIRLYATKIEGVSPLIRASVSLKDAEERIEGQTSGLPEKPPQASSLGLIVTKPAIAQALLLLALPFYGRARFRAFYKAICYQD
jgi:hypothetical protein